MTVPPHGGRGRALALGLTLLVGVTGWLAVAAPLLDLYGRRRERLWTEERQAGRMANLAASLPRLRLAAPAVAEHAPGETDAMAAANLQQTLQALIAGSGARFGSIETAPATTGVAGRRIGLRVALAAPWPNLIQLLLAIERARPRIAVEALALQAAPVRSGEEPLTVSLLLTAARAAP